MNPQAKFPQMPVELRIVIVSYLVFLIVLGIWGAGVKSRSVSAPSGGTMDRQTGFHGDRHGRQLQDWERRIDGNLRNVFTSHGLTVEESVWRLRRRGGPAPVQWVETEYRLRLASRNPIEVLSAARKKIDERMIRSGLKVLFADGLRMGEVTYYRIDYGVSWGNDSLTTHRLYFALPSLRSRALLSGLVLKPGSAPPSPSAEISRIKPVAQRRTGPRPEERTAEPPSAATLLPSRVPAEPKVAIIIDDFGFVKGPAEAFFQIRAPLTIAVLPGGPYSREHALLAERAGFEVLLHQPLEPVDRRKNNPGPGVIASDEPEEAIRNRFRANLADVPGAVGFNNHMGSAGTSDRRLMRILISEAKNNGLFFIDSRTGRSVGGEIALELGVPHAVNKIFLDNKIEDLRRQLDELKRIALRDGWAIGIAHARPGVAQVIADYLPVFDQAGIKIVHVSELVRQTLP